MTSTTPLASKLGRVIGIVAVCSLLLSLNLAVAQRGLFSLWVLAPLGLAAVLSMVWAALVLKAAAGRGGQRGRALGGLSAGIASIVFLGICIVIYAFVRSLGISYDLTQEGRRDLSPQTIQVLQSMTREVTVTCLFLSIDDELVRIARDKTLRFLDQCQAYTDLLKIEEIDPQVDVLILQEMGLGIVSRQGTVVIGSGAAKRVIRLSGGSPRLDERDFTSALIGVLRGAAPRVYYLNGHREADLADKNPKGGAVFLDLLERESYQVLPFTIDMAKAEIPANCNLLLVNGPQSDFHPEELRAIKAYLDLGGSMMLLVNPWIQRGPDSQETNLGLWLKNNYGVLLGDDLILRDPGQKPMSSEIQLRADNAPFADVDEGFMEYFGSFRADHPITQGFNEQMLLQGNRTVSVAANAPEGVIGTELLRTPPDYWAEKDIGKYVESKGDATRATWEKQGPLSIAVAVTAPATPENPDAKRREDVRLVVVGNAKVTANDDLQFSGHTNFVFNALAWLTETGELIAIRPAGKEDPPLILSPAEQSAVAWVSILLTVQTVLLAGGAMYLARRRHQ